MISFILELSNAEALSINQTIMEEPSDLVPVGGELAATPRTVADRARHSATSSDIGERQPAVFCNRR